MASDQRPPWRPQTVGGAHRAPTQCKLCIPFYLPDTAGNFKGFPARGRLLGKKAISRAQLGGGHREGKNPGCGDPPGEKTGLGGDLENREHLWASWPIAPTATGLAPSPALSTAPRRQYGFAKTGKLHLAMFLPAGPGATSARCNTKRL